MNVSRIAAEGEGHATVQGAIDVTTVASTLSFSHTGALGRRRSDESNERRGGRRHGRRNRRSTSA